MQCFPGPLSSLHSDHNTMKPTRAAPADENASSDDTLAINWKDDILIPSTTPSFEQDLLSILRGFRNGLIYGVKIRFPHALVMTVLFQRHKPINEMASSIFQKTRQHSLNLGRFVCLYKLLVVLIRRLLQFPHNHFPIIHILGMCSLFIV